MTVVDVVVFCLVVVILVVVTDLGAKGFAEVTAIVGLVVLRVVVVVVRLTVVVVRASRTVASGSLVVTVVM